MSGFMSGSVSQSPTVWEDRDRTETVLEVPEGYALYATSSDLGYGPSCVRVSARPASNEDDDNRSWQLAIWQPTISMLGSQVRIEGVMPPVDLLLAAAADDQFEGEIDGPLLYTRMTLSTFARSRSCPTTPSQPTALEGKP